MTRFLQPPWLASWETTDVQDEVGLPRRPRRFERRLSAVYARSGVTGLYGVTAVVMISSTMLYSALVAAVTTGLYLHASSGQCVRLVALCALLAPIGIIAGVATLWQIVVADLRWSRGPSQEEALENWYNLARGTVLYVFRAVSGVVILEIAWVVLSVLELHRGPWVGVLLAVVVVVCAAAFAPIAVLVADVIFRPRTQEVASYLPDDVSPSMRGLSSRTKTLMPVPGTIVYTAVLAGAVTPHVSGAGRAVVAIGVGILLAAVVISVLEMTSGAALDPIRLLVEATGQVKDGKLPADLPVLNNDELGLLSRSFNSMLVGLREREALRDHNAELVGELRASRERIVTAADAARRQVERDLHDGAQQRLVLLGLKLSALERAATNQTERPGGPGPADRDSLRADFADLHGEVRAALDELRRLAHGIYPPSLKYEGLATALAEAANHTAIPVEIAVAAANRYPEELEAAIYFCCLEALQNAAKHGGAGVSAEVELTHREDRLCFAVRDDGAGFDVTRDTRSAGLQNMRDRLGAVGGAVEISSATGKGTTVTGTVPLPGRDLDTSDTGDGGVPSTTFPRLDHDRHALSRRPV